MWRPFCLKRFQKLYLCPASLVERTRLAGHKQSFLNLLRQNGRHVTKVYCLCFSTFWRCLYLYYLSKYYLFHWVLCSTLLAVVWASRFYNVMSALYKYFKNPYFFKYIVSLLSMESVFRLCFLLGVHLIIGILHTFYSTGDCFLVVKLT